MVTIDDIGTAPIKITSNLFNNLSVSITKYSADNEDAKLCI